MHLPHLIGPMKHYLWILKTTHGGADMDTCLEMAKGGLDGKPNVYHRLCAFLFSLGFCLMETTVTIGVKALYMKACFCNSA